VVCLSVSVRIIRGTYSICTKEFILLFHTVVFSVNSELRRRLTCCQIYSEPAKRKSPAETSTIAIGTLKSTAFSIIEITNMSSMSRYALDSLNLRDPYADDPSWELVEHYRRICQDKRTLQEDILRELDKQEREAELDIEQARIALAEIRMERQAITANRGQSSTLAYDNHGLGERPAITDLDGPREDPIPNGDPASHTVRADRLAAATSNSPVEVRVGAAVVYSPSFGVSIPLAVSAPDVGPSLLPADGSIFTKYNEMIVALRTRSPPLTLTFIPREEIPWPLLPSDGVFPVVLSGRNPIELESVAEFAAGYALWRAMPLGKTINILLGHWISMDKRLKDASEKMRQGASEASSEASQTRRWIASVRSRLFAITGENGT
jgi:hypothetical protein